MSTSSTIPIVIEPEASEQVTSLGMNEEFDAMLEQARSIVPHLHSIQVVKFVDDLDPDEPRVFIKAWHQGTTSETVFSRECWGRWFTSTFSADVRRHFGFTTRFWVNNEG